MQICFIQYDGEELCPEKDHHGLTISEWQHENENFDHAKSFLNIALQICEQIKWGSNAEIDLPYEVDYALEVAANDTHDRETCIERSQRLLSIRLDDPKAGGQPNIRQAVAYNETGIGYMRNNDPVAAEKSFLKGIDIYQCLFDYWKGMVSLTRADLGLSYWPQGRLNGALDVLLQSLKFHEKHFGYMDKDSFRYGCMKHVAAFADISAESAAYYMRCSTDSTTEARPFKAKRTNGVLCSSINRLWVRNITVLLTHATKWHSTVFDEEITTVLGQ